MGTAIGRPTLNVIYVYIVFSTSTCVMRETVIRPIVFSSCDTNGISEKVSAVNRYFCVQIVFLQCDRYVEVHSQQGRYYRLRIPKAGHKPNS
jgi:hypothetical protein